MAEEFVRLVKIGIDKGFIQDSIANADRLAKSIDELKRIKKEEGQLSAEQEGRLKALTAERNKSLQVVKQANLLTSEQIKGQERLKAQLSILTAQFNKLTTEEQKNTKEGQALQKQILGITEELKANEKAVGNNRRNVGNYEDALKGVAGQINVMGVNLGNLVQQLQAQKDGVVAAGAAMKASAASTTGFAGALKILSVALLSTGIGAIVIALGSMITFLTQTKRGSELLAQAMAAVGASISVVVDRISQVGEAVTNFFTGSGSVLDVVNTTKNAFTGLTDEIQRETKAATDLEKRMQKLRDAERQLIVSTAQRNAEVAKLRVTIEDQSKSEEERLKAAQRATALQRQTIEEEKALAQERVEIIEQQLALSENLEEDEQKLADAKSMRFQVEERATTRLVELNNKEVQLRKEIAKNKQAAVDAAKKLSEEEVKAEQKRLEDLERSYQEERRLIEQNAQLKISQAEIEIANEEARAERIAFIKREALLAKLRSIEDETAAYTASADAIGAVDEEKYAKQLAERAKYEAELAALDRAAKAEAFTREIDLLNGQEQLDIEAAELSIKNEQELQKKKYQIALDYAQKRMELMRQEAMLDGIITEEEKQNLQSVENEIKRIQAGLEDSEKPKVGDALGLSDEQLEKIQAALSIVQQAVQATQQLVTAVYEDRLQQIDNELKADIAAVKSSTKSEEDKQKEISKLEKKAAKEQYKIELQQFKTAKSLNIVLAVINTAQAVLQALANTSPPASYALAAVAAALGAVQIGTIASQAPPPPPAFATGGKVVGAGTGTSDSIPARLSNGEAVINAKSTSMFEPILSAINKAGGGVDWYRGEGFSKGGIVQKFAAGGVAISSGSIMRDNIATREIQQTILNAPPVLVIEEFQNVQGRQVRTEQNLQV